MGFDTGSSALQIFPYELTSLMRDLSFCHRAIVRYPTGSVEGRSFDLMIRILSPAGKECLPWLLERAGCVGEGEVRLSGHAFQDNCLITMDPANQVLQATTRRRWTALLAALGPAILQWPSPCFRLHCSVFVLVVSIDIHIQHTRACDR